MTLAGAGRPEQDQIGAPAQPGIAGGQRHDLGLADHRDGLEVEGIECLAGRQPGFGQMAFDAASAALGHLMLGQGGKETCRWPALFDGGKSQLGEEQRETGGVDGIGRFHAASPDRTVPSSS